MAKSGTPRFVGRRMLWAAGVIWLTLTVSFAVLWVLPDSRMVFMAEVEMGLAAVGAAKGNVLASYLAWMESFLTLDWGHSVYYQKRVTDLYWNRIPVTLAYLTPAFLASVAVGTGLTTYTATDRGSAPNRALIVLSVLGLGIPTFVLAHAFFILQVSHLGWIQVYDPDLGLWSTRNLLRLQVPAAIVALGFMAVQVRHVQTETLDKLNEGYIKTARAKGASRLRLTQHVFRNAWPSIASLVQGEALSLLLLSTIVVELRLDVPGVAVAVYHGFAAGDPMVSFTAIFGIVLFSVSATVARDFTRYLLDPQYGE